MNEFFTVLRVREIFFSLNLETCGIFCFFEQGCLHKLHWQPTRLEKKKGIDAAIINKLYFVTYF